VEEAPFPVEPVEPGPAQKRSLRRELSTFANVYTQKSVECVKNRQSVVISFRVNSIIFNKYHSLSREKKRFIKSIVEKMVEQLADGNSLSISMSVTNVNLSINAQVVQQIVERAGVKELKQQLKRYESVIQCVKAVVYGNFSNKLELVKKCLQ